MIRPEDGVRIVDGVPLVTIGGIAPPTQDLEIIDSEETIPEFITLLPKERAILAERAFAQNNAKVDKTTTYINNPVVVVARDTGEVVDYSKPGMSHVVGKLAEYGIPAGGITEGVTIDLAVTAWGDQADLGSEVVDVKGVTYDGPGKIELKVDVEEITTTKTFMQAFNNVHVSKDGVQLRILGGVLKKRLVAEGRLGNRGNKPIYIMDEDMLDPCIYIQRGDKLVRIKIAKGKHVTSDGSALKCIRGYVIPDVNL